MERSQELITIECSGGVCRIVDRLDSVKARYISGECSYQSPGFEFAIKAAKENNSPWAHNWDGRIKLFHMGRRTFPSGLLDRVVRVLEKTYRLRVAVRYEKDTRHAITLGWNGDDYESRQFQTDAVKAAISAGRGVLQVATGGGKTFIAAQIIHHLSLNTLFLVHTKDLLHQALDVFRNVFGDSMVGQIGDGVVEPRPITVATTQTISRILGVGYALPADEEDNWLDDETEVNLPVESLEQFDVIFMDECHRVASSTAMDVMEKLRGSYRFGLSASPWRDDGADICIEAAIGPVIFSINASELYRLGVLVQPVIRMIEPEPMSFKRGTKYETIYSQYVIHNEQRNELGVKMALSMVQRGRPTLILVRAIKHGHLIQQLMSEAIGGWVPFISGTDSSQIRKRALDDIRNGRLGVLIASTIADEGLDIRPLSGLVLMAGGKSSTKALQRVGRVLRTWDGKENAEIVDFDDRVRYLMDHAAARRKLYESEEEWIVTDA